MDWQAVEQWLAAAIVPNAETIDQDPHALLAAFRALGDRHLLALKVSSSSAGQSCENLQFWQFQQALAQASGALAFLQLQHQSAAVFLYESPNLTLTQPLLPHLANGKVGIGVAFSHLRQAGSLDAFAEPGGWRLTGVAPWATGFGLFEWVLVGAHLPDGRLLLSLLPFRDQTLDGGTVCVSEPLSLAAMGVTQTVSLQFDHFPVRAEQVVAIHPQTWLQERDRRNVLSPTAGLMGCAQAALQQIEQHGPGGIATQVLQALLQRWQGLRQQIQTHLTGPSVDYETGLNLRAQAVALAFQCVQIAVIACGGSANALSHPSQRLYREALAWAVLGQTTDVRRASLAEQACFCRSDDK
jgi:alkylation response protein AidB-like acyl-CoA dehydrogenase